jgi:hypothetical protein
VQGEPEEALEGQGEVVMAEANTDLIPTQLKEFAQQILHSFEASNEEKDILEEEFDTVKQGIHIMEFRLQTEKAGIDCKILEVGTMAHLQDAVLQELRSGIHILQSQDNQIVGEATDLFNGICQELKALSK